METQADELSTDRHIRMNFLEFLEALARAADIISLGPAELKAMKEASKKKPKVQEMRATSIDEPEELETPPVKEIVSH